jgi:hypothetical protein
MTLRDSVAEFVGKPPGSIRIVMIHLRRATEREAMITTLASAVHTPFEIQDAVDGRALIEQGHPTECGIDPGVQRTAGEIGCAASHLAAYRTALADGLSHLVVFEDDCAAGGGFSLEGLRQYLTRAKTLIDQFSMSVDLTLLSTCGCYSWRPLTPGVKATNHFNGSHAYIIGRDMMQKIVSFYGCLEAARKTAPIDGVIPIVLQLEHQWALCPEDDVGLFKQDRSLPSYVVSDGEALRTG